MRADGLLVGLTLGETERGPHLTLETHINASLGSCTGSPLEHGSTFTPFLTLETVDKTLDIRRMLQWMDGETEVVKEHEGASGFVLVSLPLRPEEGSSDRRPCPGSDVFLLSVN